MHHSTHPDLEDKVRELAEEIMNDPLRSDYISLGQVYREYKDDYPESSKRAVSQAFGTVMGDADFLDSFSDQSYQIREDKL